MLLVSVPLCEGGRSGRRTGGQRSDKEPVCKAGRGHDDEGPDGLVPVPPEGADEFASARPAGVQAEEGEGREGLEGKEAREEARLQVAELLSREGQVGDRASDEGMPDGRAEYGPEAVSRRVVFARCCRMWGKAVDLLSVPAWNAKAGMRMFPAEVDRLVLYVHVRLSSESRAMQRTSPAGKGCRIRWSGEGRLTRRCRRPWVQ